VKAIRQKRGLQHSEFQSIHFQKKHQETKSITQMPTSTRPAPSTAS
jgi:hypothetical protein